MIKFNSVSLTLTGFCLMAIVMCICIQDTNARSIAIKNRAGGDLTVVIDFGKKNKKETKEETSNVSSELPAVDETTKKIVGQVQNVISNEEEKKISESLLTFANEIRQMEKLIPGSNDDQKLAKQELLAVVSELTKDAEKPSAFILKSSLEMVAEAKKAQTTSSTSSSTEGGAQSLFIQAGISLLNNAMNLADGIGTYSTKMSKIGNWVSGKLAPKLDSWGLKSVATLARNTGTGIDGLAKKVAPYEQKLAKAIAPVVKSKTFQSIKRVVNVVGGAISIKNGLKSIGMLSTKLPKTFNKLKKSLTKAAGPIKSKVAPLLKKVTKSGAAVKKAIASKLAINNAKKVGKLANGGKKAAKAAKKPGVFSKAIHAAKGAKDLKEGVGDMKSGLFGEGKPNQAKQTNKTNPQRGNARTANGSSSARRTNSRAAPRSTGRTSPTRSTNTRTTPSRGNARTTNSSNSSRRTAPPTRNTSRPSANRSASGRSSSGSRSSSSSSTKAPPKKRK